MADDLLVIIPTRGRPQAIPEIMQAWDDTGATADVLFCVDKDDPELAAYKVQAKAYAEDGRVRFVFWARNWRSTKPSRMRRKAWTSTPEPRCALAPVETPPAGISSAGEATSEASWRE